MTPCSMDPQRELAAEEQLRREGFVIFQEGTSHLVSRSGLRRTEFDELWSEVTVLRRSVGELREIVQALETRIDSLRRPS